MAQSFSALVFQVGRSVRASVVTRTIGSDKDGNEVIVSGHSNMEVAIGGGTTNETLFKALGKIPAAKHLASGYSVAESTSYDPEGTAGISVLFGVLKTVKEAAKEEKPAKPAK